MTVSQPLALKMKEAGFPQDKSYFYWVLFGRGLAKGHPNYSPVWEIRDKNSVCNFADSRVSAPTVTEILAELPLEIDVDGICCGLEIRFTLHELSTDTAHMVFYKTEDYIGHGVMEDTLEEALGEMYCQLKKEKVI